MSIGINTDQGVATITLRGRVDVLEVGDLHSTILGAMSNAHEIAVELTDLTDVDFTVAQLLLLSRKEAEDSGKVFRIVGGSIAWNGYLDRSRLSAEFV